MAGLRTFFLLTFFSSFCAWAEPPKLVVLFNPDGSSPPDYAARVASIRSGDTVQFSDGSHFKIRRYLNEGTKTSVYLIDYQGAPSALRIPTDVRNFELEHSVTEFVEGYEELEREQVPTVRLLKWNRSRPREYAVVEKLDDYFTLQHWLEGKIATTAWQRREVELKLLKFLLATARFSKIDDFDESQVVHATGEWKLMDWQKSHRLLDTHSIRRNPDQLLTLRSVVDQLGRVKLTPEQKYYFDRIRREILKARARELDCPDLLRKAG